MILCPVCFLVLLPASLFHSLSSGVFDFLLQSSPALHGLQGICYDPLLPLLLSASQAGFAGPCIGYTCQVHLLLSFSFRVAMKRWWSLLTSSPPLTLTSRNYLLLSGGRSGSCLLHWGALSERLDSIVWKVSL